MPPPLEVGELPIESLPTAFVYYAYDHEGDLLYVGLADDVISRIASHRRAHSPWLREAARIRWERYASRALAARAEESAIRDLVPRYNIVGNWQREVAEAMGLRFLPDSQAWRRLGDAIRVRRASQRRTQTSLARDAHIELSELRALERAARERYTASMLASVETALGWRAGSIETVLTGGIATPLTEAELRERTMAEAQRILEVLPR